MKKYLLATAAISIVILAGCQDSSSQPTNIDSSTEQNSGSIESVPTPENAPVDPALQTEEKTQAVTTETQTQMSETQTQTQVSQETQTTEKSGLKVEGKVSPDFKVKKAN